MKRIAIAMVLAIILVGGMVASAAVDTHTQIGRAHV